MKKILYILLFIPFLLNGQGMNVMHTSNRSTYGAGGGSSYTTQYQTLLDTWTTDPTGDTLTWQNDMVYSLDSAGLWDKLDIFYVLGAHTNDNGEAYINWPDPTSFTITPGRQTATATYAPFVPFEGFTGNIDSAYYLNTNYNVSTDTINVRRRSVTMGAYSRASVATGTKSAGGSGTGGSFFLYPYLTGPLAGGRIVSDQTVTASNPNNSTGLYVLTRRADDDIELYRNAVTLTTVTTNPFTSLPTSDIYILATNGATLSAISDFQISVFFVSSGLTDPEVADINTIIERYMDRVGKGVQ